MTDGTRGAIEPGGRHAQEEFRDAIRTTLTQRGINMLFEVAPPACSSAAEAAG